MLNFKNRVVIVDDDVDFADALSFYLKKIGTWEITHISNIKECKKSIEQIRPELVLLDIDLNEQENGIDLGIFIREKFPHVPIIYFTNNYNEQYYEAAKKAIPNAFLDKELNELKIRQAIELALLSHNHPEDSQKSSNEIMQLSFDFMFVKIGSSFKKIYLKDISYVVYEDRYANLVIEDKLIPVNLSMRDLAKYLPSKDFMQVHQSYIVNINKISQINIVNSQVELEGKMLPIGTSFKKAVQEKLTFLS